MSLIKVKEVIGISSKSFEDALKQAIDCVVDIKKNVTGAEILSQNVSVENSQIKEYKVIVKVAYKWEKELYEK